MELQHQLFKENNSLRSKLHELERNYQAKSVQLESLEEELWKTKEKVKDLEKATSIIGRAKSKDDVHTEHSQITVSNMEASRNRALHRDLEEAIILVEKKEAQISTLKDRIDNLQTDIDKQTEIIDTQNNEITELNRKINSLELQQKEANKKIATLKEATINSTSVQSSMQRNDAGADKEKLAFAEATIANMKKQLVDVVIEANRKHSELQTKLQSYEGIVESVRLEYEEFIAVSRLENETHRIAHHREYEVLMQEFESYKLDQVEIKRRLMEEYQDILQAVQAQFEEYRTMAEYVFNLEVAKYQDLLSSQALRYEQELLYVIHVKDKFYSEMLVAKDAKIMSLIEGSDLQSVIQRSEMDMENLRKEHQKELEFIKSHQETEQRNIITLLQRQNMSLENKYDKIQAHVKSLEVRIRELMQVIEQKNKTLAEKDHTRQEIEAKYKKKLDELVWKLTDTIQEKERIRHKLIRVQLNNKGDHNNSVEGLLRRITDESERLTIEVDSMSRVHEDMLYQNSELERNLDEKEKSIQYLEKEISRRNKEYQSMTKTFEKFLNLRTKQLNNKKTNGVVFSGRRNAPNDSQNGSILNGKRHDHRSLSNNLLDKHNEEQSEMEKGYDYLKKFKALSRAFVTGDYRNISNNGTTDFTNNISKIPLYEKLTQVNETIAKIYENNPDNEDCLEEIEEFSEEPNIYHRHNKKKEHHDPMLKLYRATEQVTVNNGAIKSSYNGQQKTTELAITGKQKTVPKHGRVGDSGY